MDPQTVALILQAGQIIATIAPVALQTALELQKIFSASGSDYTVSIKTFQDGALQTAEETLDLIAQWKAEHGFTD